MAQTIPREGMLIVPHGSQDLCESFLKYLWEYEIPAFLAKPSWVREQESGATGLELRVAPGTC